MLQGVNSLVAGHLRKVLRIYEEGTSNVMVLERGGVDPLAFFRAQACSKTESVRQDTFREVTLKSVELSRAQFPKDCSFLTTLARRPLWSGRRFPLKLHVRALCVGSTLRRRPEYSSTSLSDTPDLISRPGSTSFSQGFTLSVRAALLWLLPRQAT